MRDMHQWAMRCGAVLFAMALLGSCGGDEDGTPPGNGGTGGIGGSGAVGGTGGTGAVGGTGGTGAVGGTGGTGAVGGTGGTGAVGGTGGTGAVGGSGGAGGEGGEGGEGGSGGTGGEGGSGGAGGGGGEGGAGGTGGAEVPVAELRLIHALEDGALDLYVDGTLIAPNVLPDSATAWSELDAGTVGVTLSRAGDASDVVLDTTITLADGIAYSLVVFGPADEPELDAVERPAAAVTPANARVQLVHGASAHPSVTAWDFTDPMQPIAISGSALSYGSYVTAEIPAGTRRLGVDVDADNVPDRFVTLEPLDALEDALIVLGANGTTNAVSALHVGGTGTATRNAEEMPPFAWVTYANLNAFRNVPNGVDFYAVGATPILTNLPIAIGAGRMPVIAGRREITVTATGSPRATPLVTAPNLQLVEGENHELIYWGNNTQHGIAMLPAVDATGTAADTARLQIAHFVAGFPAADIYVNGTLAANNLAAGFTSGTIDVPTTSPVTLGIDLTEDGTPEFVFSIDGLTPQSGYLLAGSADAVAPYLLLLPGGTGASRRIDPTSP